jgi:hypothetical protein
MINHSTFCTSYFPNYVDYYLTKPHLKASIFALNFLRIGRTMAIKIALCIPTPMIFFLYLQPRYGFKKNDLILQVAIANFYCLSYSKYYC